MKLPALDRPTRFAFGVVNPTMPGLALSYPYPIEESWNSINDRTVLSGVYLVDGSIAAGSAAGIGQ